MTIKYIDNIGAIISDATVAKIEPVQNGTKYLVTATTDFLIPVKDLIEVTSV